MECATKPTVEEALENAMLWSGMMAEPPRGQTDLMSAVRSFQPYERLALGAG
jgi:hypothetical protein